jgi:hypothetical protein
MTVYCDKATGNILCEVTEEPGQAIRVGPTSSDIMECGDGDFVVKFTNARFSKVISKTRFLANYKEFKDDDNK